MVGFNKMRVNFRRIFVDLCLLFWVIDQRRHAFSWWRFLRNLMLSF